METLALEKLDSKKLRGGYYTPQEITKFICRWSIDKPTQNILEPSCGDGNFIEAVIERFLELGVPKNQLFGLVQGVELMPQEAQKAKNRAEAFGLNSNTIINSDFFTFLNELDKNRKFDVVVGNPPFIRYQNFPEEHRLKAFEMMNKIGLKPNKLTNIWVPFLVLSSNLLNENGKLGMVIPAELFQVKYASETRIFLSKFFPRITIITFKKLVFKEIQQEVVLLLCEKNITDNKGIRVVEVNTLEELKNLDINAIQKEDVKVLEHNSEKWTKYFLEEKEIQYLRKVKADPRIRLAGEFMITNVGLVTGINEFFMINEKTAKEWNIKEYTKKVVSRSNHFKGIFFNESDFIDNAEADIEGYLFFPPDVDFNELPEVCKNYIRFGESKGFHQGYKCRIRKRWYITPSIYTPDGFALRQVGDYPKIIINKTEASSTDTIHRVRFRTDISPDIIAVSFLNSLSFAFSEITGRSYGGGVLTFEPTEIGEIPLPVLSENSNIDFDKIDKLIRERRIEEVLDIVDAELLIKQLKFSKTQVKMFRNIWLKMSNRRQNRK
ncbi:SAM-dependent methyltransferase [Flavobacterium sp. WLB]|uniref:N-6 DNA methylase n=1 Tax=Flavobacterium sp. WLB TaxID=2161662 RepID=UPI000D3D712B|nr:N-6 DNA methylase [Flavobacterium sp. WLB]PUU69041.1 SAM-dependent methyltransferase [Flavobacterium sp. WLB]